MPGVARPLEIASTSRPWAIRPLNGVLAVTHCSLMCSWLKSPETPAKAMMSASVTVRPTDVKTWPGAKSSR